MLTDEQKEKNKEARRKKTLRNQKRLWMSLGAIFFLLFFGPYLWGPIGVNIHYSEGERRIQIVKIASKGLIWKSWEVEGLIAPGHGIATTYVWDFSIDNDDPRKETLFNQIKQAYEQGRTVNVRYDQRAGFVPWRSKTSYFVSEVGVIE